MNCPFTNGHHVYKEPNFHYDAIPLLDNIRLEGYFQSARYWEGYEDTIKELFAPNNRLLEYVSHKYDHIVKDATAVHVRRGDYLEKAEYHYNLGLDYYQEAAYSMQKTSEHYSPVILFSDDIEWCQEHWTGVTYIHEDPITDFFVMSRCKNFIIANSSFSWWASYLATHPDKQIIAPSKWFGSKKAHFDLKDLYRPEFKVLTNV